jgi:hypothetical protein
MSVGVVAASYVPAVVALTRYPTAVLADAPLGYWRLGETSGTTMVDSSGNGHDGTYNGSPTLGAAGLLTGDTDKAVQLSGVSQSATVANGSWMNTGSVTLEALVYLDNLSQTATILDRDQDNSNRSFQWTITTAGKLLTNFWVSGVLKTLTSTTTLVVGRIYHVVLTYDGTTIRQYVNGVQDATTLVAAGVMTSTSSWLQVGANRTIFAELAGRIDEAAYYGVALSAAQIVAHWVASRGSTSPYANAVLTDLPTAYYRLGESSGSVMVDSSGNGRDGVYRGFGGVVTAPTHVDGGLAGDTDTAVSRTASDSAETPYAAWMNTPALTIEMLFKASSDAGVKTLASRRNAGNAWQFRTNGTTLELLVWNNGGFGGSTTFANAVSVAKGWQHLAATHDGTTGRLYINGTQVASAATTANKADTTSTFLINTASTAENGAGTYDEVALYSTVLSDTRILAHWVTSRAATAYETAVLTDLPWGYWRESPSNVLAADASGNNRSPNLSNYAQVAPILSGDTGFSVTGTGSGEVANHPLVGLPGLASGDSSFECWVDIPAANVNGPILSLGSEPSNGWAVGVGGSTFDNAGHVLILARNGVAWHASGYTMATGLHHLAITRTSGNVFIAYVDGVQRYTFTAAPNAATGYFNVGGVAGGRVLSSSVKIDNVVGYASVLSPTRITAHYNSGTWDKAAVLADGPVFLWQFDDVAATITNIVDSSGNGRTLSSGGAVTRTTPGPTTGGAYASFPTGDAYQFGGNITPAPTTAAIEAWIYLPAIPSARTIVITPGGSTVCHMEIDTTGRVVFGLWNGNSVPIGAANPLPLNQWCHVVCSIGASGARIRINKVDAATSVITAFTAASANVPVYIRGGYGTSSPTGTAAMRIAEPAFYVHELTTARIDAHYDAALV